MKVLLSNLGSPLRPTVSLFQEHVINNIITYRLNWSKPFTWTGFPIFSYEVILYNISSGEPVTAIKHVNDSGPLSLTHHGISDGPACYLLNFSVAAINRVGRGEPASIQSGHLIGKADYLVNFWLKLVNSSRWNRRHRNCSYLCIKRNTSFLDEFLGKTQYLQLLPPAET